MNIGDTVEIPQMSAAVNGDDGQLAMVVVHGTVVAVPQSPESTIYVVEVGGCEIEFDKTELRPIGYDALRLTGVSLTETLLELLPRYDRIVSDVE